MASRQEILQVAREFGRHLAGGKARDVQRLEFFWHVRALPRGSKESAVGESF